MRILSIVLSSVGLSTVLGIVIGLLVRRIPHRMNDMVLGFAAGVMLAAAVIGLLEPAFSMSSGVITVPLALAGTFAGAAFIAFLDRIVPHLHRLAGIDGDSGQDAKSVGKVLLFVTAIALHKIPEGIATGLSFATGSSGNAIMVAGAISLQNIPEAAVIVSPLVAIGVKSKRILAISFGIAALSVISVLAGCLPLFAFGSDSFHLIRPFLLGAAGGAMLFVIGNEMIPETHAHGFEKQATFALLAGLAAVFVFQRLLPMQ